MSCRVEWTYDKARSEDERLVHGQDGLKLRLQADDEAMRT